MDDSLKQLQDELKKKNIQLSYQRLRVLEYLSKNRSHPTVDRIFTDIRKEIPSLSKTTVYNTLRILEEAGLVRIVNIEDNETRYDIEMKQHGHFKCESCGVIFNFKVDFDKLISEDLKNFGVDDKNVHFKGICPECLSAKNKK